MQATAHLQYSDLGYEDRFGPRVELRKRVILRQEKGLGGTLTHNGKTG